MKQIEILKKLFTAAVTSVQPELLARQAVYASGNHLFVKEETFELKKPVHLIGFGKAVIGMAHALQDILGTNLYRGIVSVPFGSSGMIENRADDDSRICFLEGARNNLPDENAYLSSMQIIKMVDGLSENDIVIVLISGGGSALLPLPKGRITITEKMDLIKKLSNSGATISEMNCVRKVLSKVKGGGLARICYPAKVISLIISDVIGDAIDIIASGPTVRNHDSLEKALEILEKYQLYETLPCSIREVLDNSPLFESEELCDKNGEFIHVHNFIVGNNIRAVKNAQVMAKNMGYQTIIISTEVSGDVYNVCKVYSDISKVLSDFLSNKIPRNEVINYFQQLKLNFPLYEKDSMIRDVTLLDHNEDICLILGGEPTVSVIGKGKGGRNQQLALAYSIELHQSNQKGIWFLSGGTDGIDGPTDAAGAIAYSNLVEDCSTTDLQPDAHIANNDCYTFYQKFKEGEYLVKTGHTGTNVMDIHIIFIQRMGTCQL